MEELTAGFRHWLRMNHNDKETLILWGHTDLITDEMRTQYAEWCKTKEGKRYLQGERNEERENVF